MSHWLTNRLEEVQTRYDAWLQLRQRGEGRPAADAADVTTARAAFLHDLARLVEEVAERRGIHAVFASHDGLLVHCVGSQAEADALAAVAASVVQPAYAAARTLGLGELHQVVFAGDERKLALMMVGDISIGVLAPVGLHLAEVLAAQPA